MTIVFAITHADVTVEHGPLQLPSEVQVAGGEYVDRVTTCGWEYRLFTREHGVEALYVFEDHVSSVRAAGPIARVLEVLDSARPDWCSDEIIALAQLWS